MLRAHAQDPAHQEGLEAFQSCKASNVGDHVLFSWKPTLTQSVDVLHEYLFLSDGQGFFFVALLRILRHSGVGDFY